MRIASEPSKFDHLSPVAWRKLSKLMRIDCRIKLTPIRERKTFTTTTTIKQKNLTSALTIDICLATKTIPD